MLALCSSLIVTGRRSDFAELAAFSRQVGFGAIIDPDSTDPAPAAPGPITYFMIDSQTPRDRMRSVIRALRRSADIHLRFAPVILLGPALPQSQLQAFAAEGFDDLITLPMDPMRAAARLEAQLARPHDYFETADYLGPDRRRFSQREQTGTGSYVLYHVWRDPVTGVRTRAARIAGKPRFEPSIKAARG